MKCTCPICRETLSVDENGHDEGDFVKCEECGELLTLEVRRGAYKLVTDQEKKIEEIEDLPEEFDIDDED